MDIDQLGKYEIRSTLGKGAMGTVYEGWDPIISRKVAVKTVRLPDAADIDAQEELARFKREAQAAGRLSHPNIVGVFDYGETDKLAYIVMEFVDGKPLKSILDAGDRLPLAQVGRVMADVLAGLHYSHDRGVIHRDIKPANIMITASDGQAKIADFGIARIESSNMTQAGTIMGTPAYMSPEQFMGQTVDARTDIYSCGVMLFQLLTGDRPFEGSMATIMHKALNTVPPKPSELSVTAPVSLDAVVARAMAKRPDERFPIAAAFAAAFQGALADPKPASLLGPGLGDLGEDATIITASPKTAGQPAQPQTPPPAIQKPRSRAPMLGAAAAIVLALAGGGAWFVFSGPSGGTQNPPGPIKHDPAGPSTPTLSASTGTGPGTVASIQPPVPPGPAATATQPNPPVSSTPTNPPQPTGSGRPTNLANIPISPAVVEPPQPATPIAPPVTASTSPAAGSATSVPGVIPPVQPVQPDPAITSPPVTTSVPNPPNPVGAAVPPVTPSTNPPNSSNTAETSASPEPSVHASAAITPEALRRAVASAVSSTDCALVNGDLSAAGTVDLRGVIVQGQPEQALQQNIRGAAPTAAVDWHLGILKGDYCGPLDAIRAYARPFGATYGGLDLTLNSARGSLVTNDKIEIRTTLPNYAAYLFIDYFSSDGSVAHFRLPTSGTQLLQAGSTHTSLLGTVFPPFGTDLIVAIASSTPLFGKDTLAQTADEYVRQLRTALDAAARRGRVASNALMVLTAARP